MNPGDMILVRKSDTGGMVVLPGTRYSQGIVVESQANYGTVMVRWSDGMLHLEEVKHLKKYYEIISR